MTYDQDSRALVTRSVAEVMDSYSHGQTGDDAILADAIRDVSEKLGRAIKARKLDEARGLTLRLDEMAGRLGTVLKYANYGGL